MRSKTRVSQVDFCEQVVLPALFIRLNEVFPEFGWERTGRGWTATNNDHTKSLVGARADRVVCNVSFGFYVHGGKHTPWLSYLNNGTMPRGHEYVDKLKELARRVGLDTSPMERELTPAEEAHQKQRAIRDEIFETFQAQAHEALLTADGTRGRDYLVKNRGFKQEILQDLPFGFFTGPEKVNASLIAAGFKAEDVDASGLVRDRRWAGRLVAPWRDPRGYIGSFWARDLTGTAEGSEKYLYLAVEKGWAVKKELLVLFGLYEALKHKETREHLVVVEGLIDAVSLPAQGMPNVAAIGGSGEQMTVNKWEALARLGIKTVTLVLDNDRKPDGSWPGREGTVAALANARKAKAAPRIFVLDPVEMGNAKDPDELVRKDGLKVFHAALEKAVHAFTFEAQDIIRKHKPEDNWTDRGLDAALDEAIAFDTALSTDAALALGSFFWPYILQTTGADESAINARLETVHQKQRKEVKERATREMFREANQAFQAGETNKALSVLSDRLDLIQADERILKAGPVLSVADELPAHEEYLAPNRGREFIGLPQKTLSKLDEWTLGLRGLMLLVSAPNVGKTALSVQMGTDIVVHNPDACFLFVSLEMSRMDIITRILCRLAGMNWKTLVMGSGMVRGKGKVATYTQDELQRLENAQEQLADIGQHIRILDERNFPAVTKETILRQLDDLKESTGARRAFVLVDYLQVWPIPDDMAQKRWTDLEADKWRIGQMKQVRDETGDTIMAISEARKPSGNAREQWGGAMADVMGSARGSYTPDMLFLFRTFTERELADLFSWKPKKAKDDEKKAELKRWAKRRREMMAKKGVSYCKLEIVKGRDGVHKGELELTFRFRLSTFEEEVNPANDNYDPDTDDNADGVDDWGDEVEDSD